MANDTSTDWVGTLIVKLETATTGVLDFEVGGVPINAQLGIALIQFLKTNKDFLIKLGQDDFVDFLYLLHEKKEEEAFLLLSAKMDADDIISKMEADAGALQQLNDAHDKFVADLIDFGKTAVLPTLAKALIGLLIP